MVELKGSLGSLGLPSIVQLIGELHHSGNLELTRDTARAVLGFDDGRLVAASYGDQRGLKALAACAVELADADFVFVEGAPAEERTLDLGGSELQKQLARLMSGEVTDEVLAPTSAKADVQQAPGICPLLGFVDDQTRHYSRPTALHRCFAGGSPSVATAQEQRELCLSGRYSTCPRFRQASTFVRASPPPAAAPAPEPVRSSPPPAVAPRGVPAGVAGRMAAAAQMQIANEKSTTDVPAWIGQEQPEPSAEAKVEPGATRFGLGRRRGLLLVAVGVVLGLVVLVGVVLLARSALSGGLAPKTTNAVGPQTGAVAAAATSAVPPAAAAPTPAAPPTTVAGAAITKADAIATSAPRQVAATAAALPVTPTRVAPSAPPPPVATPTAQALPAVPAAGQSLIDVRFASGAKPGWIDNPPYVTWSDGAYRFQARQPTHFVAVSAPLDRPIDDVVVSATFRKTGGPPGGGYGLVVRDQSPDPLDGVTQNASFYVMEAGDLGDFGVWRRDGDHWVDLVPWEHAASVRPGGSPNDLAVRALGDRLTFMVNDTQVASIQDNTLVAGRVGAFVGGDYNEVALDRFVVQVPD